MRCRKLFSYATALAVTAVLAWSPAPANSGNSPLRPAIDTNPSGAAGGHVGPTSPSPHLDLGLDDLLCPRIETGAPAEIPVDVSDVARQAHVPVATTALWENLAGLSPAKRGSARIELEFGTLASEADRALGARVAEQWAAGDFEGAIATLRAFEKAGGRAALGIAWEPGEGPIVPHDGTDVRIGGTRTGGNTVCLDFDAATGALFAVVRWGSTSGTASWTVSRSANQGTTWTETYEWTSSVGILDVSAAVVSGYVYVGYTFPTGNTEMRIRRCLTATGASDAAYGFHSILTTATATIVELGVATNAEDINNRIYGFTIQSDHALRWAWDVSTDGTTFTEEATGISNASMGLDVSWGNGYECSAFLFVSYAGTDGYVHVQRYTPSSWTDSPIVTSSGVERPTSISVHDQTVICAYEYIYTEGRGIRYSISYDCGATWSYGDLAVPDGTTQFSFLAPDVDARDGHGTAVTYCAEVGEPDPVYYHFRWGYAPGVWEDRMEFNDHDVLTGTETAVAHLPRWNARTISHGAIYFDGSGTIPYFDYPGLGVVGVPQELPPPADRIALRFASGNPARGEARLELVMPAGGRAVVGVYDVRGALVKPIARDAFAAGRHPLVWDGTNAGGLPVEPGIYFVLVRSTLGEAQLRLVRL